MTHGYLIADSGSTKCEWAAIGGGEPERLRTAGINAVQQPDETIDGVLAGLPASWRPERIRFYGAGCGETFPEATARLRAALSRRFPGVEAEVESDLTGAARALFGRGAGIACILGTGSNSCSYDGRRIVRQVPPLGYILGDEGSGAVLGRMLAGDLLKGTAFDRKMVRRFYEAHSLTYEELIRRVYREPAANRFLASFVPFIREHIAHPDMERLVGRAFDAFVERNLCAYPRELPAGAVGGVAYCFAPQLREALRRGGFRAAKILRSPLDALIEYHGRA